MFANKTSFSRVCVLAAMLLFMQIADLEHVHSGGQLTLSDCDYCLHLSTTDDVAKSSPSALEYSASHSTISLFRRNTSVETFRDTKARSPPNA